MSTPSARDPRCRLTPRPTGPPPAHLPHNCSVLQGPNQLVWCLPTGGYDPRKHASYEACARAELSEEARLAGGTWEPLIPEGHPGIAEVKWCRWACLGGCAAAQGQGRLMLWQFLLPWWERGGY